MKTGACAAPICSPARNFSCRQPHRPFVRPFPLCQFSSLTCVRVELFVGLRQLLLQQRNLVTELAHLRVR